MVLPGHRFSASPLPLVETDCHTPSPALPLIKAPPGVVLTSRLPSTTTLPTAPPPVITTWVLSRHAIGGAAGRTASGWPVEGLRTVFPEAETGPAQISEPPSDAAWPSLALR